MAPHRHVILLHPSFFRNSQPHLWQYLILALVIISSLPNKAICRHAVEAINPHTQHTHLTDYTVEGSPFNDLLAIKWNGFTHEKSHEGSVTGQECRYMSRLIGRCFLNPQKNIMIWLANGPIILSCLLSQPQRAATNKLQCKAFIHYRPASTIQDMSLHKPMSCLH